MEIVPKGQSVFEYERVLMKCHIAIKKNKLERKTLSNKVLIFLIHIMREVSIEQSR